MARISQLPFLPCSLTKLEPTFHTFLLARNILVIYIPCTIAVCTLRELQQNFQIEFANFLLCHRKIDFCSRPHSKHRGEYKFNRTIRFRSPKMLSEFTTHMQSKYSLFEKAQAAAGAEFEWEVDWSQFFGLIPLINFTDRGIFPSRAGGAENSPVSKSCTWDCRTRLHYDRLFSDLFSWNCNFVTSVWVRCPAWMNDSCAGLPPRGELPSGCPGRSCNKDLVKKSFLRYFLTWHDGPRTCWWAASPCHSATRRTGK